jgi:TRAP-type C4-dicarboxylate transport system permease large subunit
LALVVVSTGAAIAFAKTRPAETPTDELIVVAMCVGVGVAFSLAVINKVTKMGLLSRMAERVTFVLIPPLALIFLVLGTIFLGIATPTEGGAMGAVGALIMAISRRRLSLSLMKQAMDATMKLSCFVVFILLGATVFSLTFQAVDGSVWVEHLLTGLPGGQVGFLIVVNLLVFFLAFFLDFFELAFIVVPLLGPVAEKLGIDLVWFGVLLAVNMQTSFMHPPFGFALFYLRSVAPHSEYIDRLTQKKIAPVTTTQIYWGAVPFVVIQVHHGRPADRLPRPGQHAGIDNAAKVDRAEHTTRSPARADAGAGRRRARMRPSKAPPTRTRSTARKTKRRKRKPMIRRRPCSSRINKGK